MRFIIEAACACNTGKVRKNNEDNFYFDGKCLGMENNGLVAPMTVSMPLENGIFYAVFDGLGGECFGECASYAAARQMQKNKRILSDIFNPATKRLERLVEQLNNAVLDAQKEKMTEHMASTMVAFYFAGRYIYSCNVGDSRSFCLRDGKLQQMSMDHVESRPVRGHAKAALTQYLGINTEEMLLEPFISKEEIQSGDMYLLCSDGLTDMLTNSEISEIMLNSETAGSRAEALVAAAMEHGGRDNITVIVCELKKRGNL